MVEVVELRKYPLSVLVFLLRCTSSRQPPLSLDVVDGRGFTMIYRATTTRVGQDYCSVGFR